MSRKAAQIILSQEERATLDRWARSRTMPLRIVQRAKIIQMASDGTDSQDIAKMLEITETEVVSIIGFYTLYYDKPEGKLRIQVCTDLPCALRGADEFLEALCEALGIGVGETTPDGMITIEAVMCLAACDKAPMFQTQGADGIKYHEHMTVETTMDLIENFKKEAK